MSGIIPNDSTSVDVARARFSAELQQEDERGSAPSSRNNSGNISGNAMRAFNEGDVYDDDNNLQHQLRPLLFCLQLTGLLRARADTRVTHGGDARATCDTHDVLLHVQCAVTLLLLWLNLAVVLAGLSDVKGFDGVLCNQLVTTVWFLQVALAATHHFRQSPRLLTLLRDFSLHAANTQLKLGPGMRHLAVVMVLAYLLWLGCAFTFGAVSSLFTALPPVFGSPGEVGRVFAHVLLVLLYLCFCSAWFLLTALYLTLSYLVVRAFRHHAECLAKQVGLTPLPGVYGAVFWLALNALLNKSNQIGYAGAVCPRETKTSQA
ncbi:hypothetical protein BaRGS_00012349 [Batillaria attramentaria]|uniref:Transmembrane protein n=1 Tax=Batillaria attramentaria TaxID=370345 RepID=A0ABD0LA86_9CAEN